MSNTLYEPYYDTFVQKHELLKPIPFVGFDDDKELSLNLTLGEIRNSSFVTESEKEQFLSVPIDSRVIEAFQILRDALGKAITVTSSFRSRAHEISRGRSGDSQHVQGKALDLSGDGLVDLLKEAVATKNKLYERLRVVGVNAFGIYEDKNFIHIDTRAAKPNGDYFYWTGASVEDEKKKEESSVLKWVFRIIALITFSYGVYKKIKDWRR